MEITKRIHEAYNEKLYHLAMCEMTGYIYLSTANNDGLFFSNNADTHFTQVSPIKNSIAAFMTINQIVGNYFHSTGNDMPADAELKKGFKNAALAVISSLNVNTKLKLISDKQREAFNEIESQLVSDSKVKELEKSLNSAVLLNLLEKSSQRIKLEEYAVMLRLEEVRKEHDALNIEIKGYQVKEKNFTSHISDNRDEYYAGVMDSILEKEYGKENNNKQQKMQKKTVVEDVDVEGNIK